MLEESNYADINKSLWNAKTDVHINSKFYDNATFLEGRNTLNSIELDLLGDISGKSVLHLQCHFGQDTISLSRMGAKVIGIDLSDKAITRAKEFAEITKSSAKFICSNIYDLPDVLDEKFDIVFTSYGVIGWLPDLDNWAKIISHFLKQKGQFVFAEFHPVVWMFDETFTKIGYNYFKDNPIIETEKGTYADLDAPIKEKSISWNHSLAEVFTSLLKNGHTINTFKEYDYSPYNCFQNTIEFEPNKYRIKHLGNKIPMVYALNATKN